MQIFNKYKEKYGYAIIPLLSTFLLNDLVYWGGMAIAGNRYHFDLTTNLDRRIPFVPGFVYIYLICYLFWIVNYVLAAGNGKDYFYRYLSADLTARLICFLFFVFFPTTNTRPELVGNSLSVHLLGWLYSIDKPATLLPSIHCMNSWFCRARPKRYPPLVPDFFLRICLAHRSVYGFHPTACRAGYCSGLPAGRTDVAVFWKNEILQKRKTIL